MSIPPGLRAPYVEKPINVARDVISIEMDFEQRLVKFPMDFTHCYHNDLPINFSPITTDEHNEHMRNTCISILDKLYSNNEFKIYSVKDCIYTKLDHIPCISS